jgi:hypothetical protein
MPGEAWSADHQDLNGERDEDGKTAEEGQQQKHPRAHSAADPIRSSAVSEELGKAGRKASCVALLYIYQETSLMAGRGVEFADWCADSTSIRRHFRREFGSRDAG